ncbi:MAG: hypothetical protein ACD_39C01461G0001, partial [uncultured bacterium]
QSDQPAPYRPHGPFETRIKMRDGEAAAEKLRKAWCQSGEHDEIRFVSEDMPALYWQLVKLAYLTPLTLKFLGLSLKTANLAGKIAHIWAGKQFARIQNVEI